MKQSQEEINRKARANYEKNPKRYYATVRKWLAAHPEKARAMKLTWRKSNRFSVALHQSRATAKMRGYKPCEATLQEIKDAFTGFCHNKACGVSEIACSRKLSLDHDHATGRFRGWLCNTCNRTIGFHSD